MDKKADLKRFKAVIATTNRDLEGEVFTAKALLENCCSDIPPQFAVISVDFDHCDIAGAGKALRFFKGSDSIAGTLELTGLLRPGLSGYIVPGGKKIVSDTGEILKAVINEFAFTTEPVDKSLSPLEYLE